MHSLPILQCAGTLETSSVRDDPRTWEKIKVSFIGCSGPSSSLFRNLWQRNFQFDSQDLMHENFLAVLVSVGFGTRMDGGVVSSVQGV